MSERPIIFSAPEVRAILDETKARMILKPQPMPSAFAPGHCPYGEPGDVLWVRETWSKVPRTAYWHDQSIPHQEHIDDYGFAWWAVYRASWERSAPSWKPSVHMPRWASRITLEVESVRVKRLRSISDTDAWREGFPPPGEPFDDDGISLFAQRWDSLNSKKPRCSWADNPFVWVIGFRRIDQ